MGDLTIIESPSKVDIDILYQGLLAYNLPFLQGAKHQPIAIFHEQNGEKLAGIYGDILGKWLRIRYLWVDEHLRMQGLGTRLLFALEEAAVTRGAEFVELDTFNFQALPFYQKHGYTIFGQLDNYPSAGQKFYLQKNLHGIFELSQPR